MSVAGPCPAGRHPTTWAESPGLLSAWAKGNSIQIGSDGRAAASQARPSASLTTWAQVMTYRGEIRKAVPTTGPAAVALTRAMACCRGAVIALPYPTRWRRVSRLTSRSG